MFEALLGMFLSNGLANSSRSKVFFSLYPHSTRQGVKVGD